SIRRSIGDQCVKLAITILAETMDGESFRQNCRAAELRQRKSFDKAGLKVGIEQTTVRAGRLRFQSKITEDVLSVELWNPGAAIDESTSDGDAVVVIIFESSLGAFDRINQA